MSSFSNVLALALFTPVGASSLSSDSNPLGSVLELIDSLAAKVTKAGEAEASAYKEYFDWCDDTSKNKGFEISTLKSRKDKLEADIAKLSDDVAAASSNIEDLSAKIAVDNSELSDATLIREKEAKQFAANEAELVDAVDTLGRAIGILEKEMSKNPAAFAQIDTSSINEVAKALSAVVDAASFNGADRKKLMALVQSGQGDDADDDDMNAPAAATYKTHSTNILDVLEDLKEKSEEELASMRKAEANTEHNYKMLRQSLEDSIAADTKGSNEEKASRAAAEEAKATAEGDQAGTVKDLEAANGALAMANSNCMQVAADHEATVRSRTEELTALAQAKKMLESTTSGAVGQTYSMLQMVAVSKLQTRSDLANAEIVNVVKQLAKQHHSAALSQLASRIATVFRYSASSGDDPFVKVRGLINELINKLTREADDAATEKAWCDEQLAKTEEKKQELDEDIAKLTTKIDQAAANSASLKDQVKELQAELAAVAKEQAEMDRIRAEEHADYTQAKADLELGLSGVRKALSVLRDYYGSASASASMLQETQPAQPELHSAASGAGGSIIDILEVVESDFATGLSKEEMQEADAVAEYDKITQENSVTRTLKNQDVKYKTQEFTGLDKSISDMTSDRASENTEFSAVMEYYTNVKGRCIAVPETYEERKARREAEINGLKDALNILENETALLQGGKRAGHRGRHGFLAA